MSAKGKLEELFKLVRAVMLGRPDVSLENRRKDQRLRLKVPVLARVDQEDLKAELLDLSPTGMRLRLPQSVERDDTVRVSASQESRLVGRQRLLCRVVWVKRRKPGCEVGLEYNDSDENLAHSWVQLALRHLDPERVKRRSRRIPAYLFVHLADHEGLELGKGICVNISTGGCLLQMDRHLPLDQGVRLGLGPGDSEPSIFLTGKILSHVEGGEPGQFFHHVQFYPGENRNHQRLRSLLMTLLEEVGEQEGLQDNAEVELEDEVEQAPSLFARLGQQPAEPVPPVGPDSPPKARPARAESPPIPKPKAPASDSKPLSERLGKPTPVQKTRSYTNRPNSLWAARNLPLRGSGKPRESPPSVEGPEEEPG